MGIGEGAIPITDDLKAVDSHCPEAVDLFLPRSGIRNGNAVLVRLQGAGPTPPGVPEVGRVRLSESFPA